MTIQRILLTGASGMVGQNVLEHPAIADYEVFTPNRVSLDLGNYAKTLNYVKDIAPDLVIHAAGKVGGIQANIQSPVDFLVENVDMGKNIVIACREAGVKKLLNFGSSCMYPRNQQTPLSEEQVMQDSLEPTNEGYALAKIYTAKLCSYVHSENLNYLYKTLIPCNLFGRHDKFDPAHSHLIPAIIHKIFQAKQQGQASVTIWGDGNARREFMYAGDLADAIISAIKSFDTLPDMMNVGIGADHTVNTYYQKVAEVIGYNGGFVHDLSKPVGMSRKLLDISVQQKWGWKAQFDLKAGIERTYQFYLKECVK